MDINDPSDKQCDYAAYVEGLEQQLDTLTAEVKQLRAENEWVSVDSYKDIPIGIWQVAELCTDGSVEGNIADIREGMSVIGGYFAWDRGRIFAYTKSTTLPSPPQDN